MIPAGMMSDKAAINPAALRMRLLLLRSSRACAWPAPLAEGRGASTAIGTLRKPVRANRPNTGRLPLERAQHRGQLVGPAEQRGRGRCDAVVDVALDVLAALLRLAP